ncbi:MAG: tRNA lysidine(34) synthetase TilS [Nitrospiraceae bacterium]
MSQSVQPQTARSKLARRVAATARAKGLLRPGDRVLVAISGGPDSVALLSVLAALAPSWDLTLQAVHVNHGLRGSESDEDASFVAGLCDRLGVPLVIERVPLTGPAGRRKGRSLQEQAREARYAAMVRVATALRMDKIALGHTADDQAETLMMWMLRGSGTAGLAGIPPARAPLVVRPLLDVGRAEILTYLEAQGVPFREDSSNAKPLYLRNRVRHELLPALKRFNPGLLGVLKRQAEILREEDLCLDQLVSEHLAQLTREDGAGTFVVDRAGLLALPLALRRRMVRTLIRRTGGLQQGPTFGAVAAVLDRVVQGRSGAAIAVPGALVAREYGSIRFRSSVPEGTEAVSLPLPVPSTIRWPLTGQTIRVSLRDLSSAHPPAIPTPSRSVAILDADLFTMELVVRSWAAGDAFRPLGMQGRRKKLQDYFADLKLPRAARRRVPLLVAPEGILWVGGHRPDHRFCATAASRRIVTAELLDPSPNGGD